MNRMTVKELRTLKVPGGSKFGNKKTLYNHRLYASKKEANRAMELDILKRSGVITSWEPQIPIPIVINGVKVCKYIADFKVTYHNGYVEYEDVKGFRTNIFILKKKLVKAVHSIDIKEI